MLLKHCGRAGEERGKFSQANVSPPCGRCAAAYLHCRVHEAGVAQVGEATEARVLALPALVRVVVAVAERLVGRQAVAGVLHTAQ